MNTAATSGATRPVMPVWLADGAALLAPFAVALVVGGIVLTVTGRDALGTYRLLLGQSFGGQIAIANTLVATTPILLAGLATAIAFRAGVFTIGVEGSLYLGAFAAAWVGFTFTGLAGVVLASLAAVAAAVAGALWSAPPAVLRAWLGVDEVVSTLMLNYVAILLTSYLVNEHFLAPGIANSMSPLVAEQARLPALIPRTQLTIAFVVALAVTAIVAVIFRATAAGYELRIAGLSPGFAAATGISLAAVIIGAMLASGLLGGLAGGLQVLGVNYRFIDRFSPGYGFTGFAVALLGRNTPVGVLLASLFFGALANGGAMIQLFSEIPIDLILLLQGTVMILAVVPFARLRRGAGIARV
ncbi:MAG: ABC transporter permease [Thermomicrobiales bacterium]